MKKNSKRKYFRYPFIIHANVLSGPALFPTHTHGLYEVGMPEFIMDPVAFGPKGNGGRIAAAYDYFKKKKNEKKLKDILNGQTVKLTGKQLSPKKMKNDPYVYCFREVTPEFEGVKISYFEKEIKEEMRFIQIYVEGDDFALTDEYYRGGVRW